HLADVAAERRELAAGEHLVVLDGHNETMRMNRDFVQLAREQVALREVFDDQRMDGARFGRLRGAQRDRFGRRHDPGTGRDRRHQTKGSGLRRCGRDAHACTATSTKANTSPKRSTARSISAWEIVSGGSMRTTFSSV